ncbi:MAG: hypothetical protein IPI72_11535 [Flavobacteriales bacterium]|nr:hypothetical protein [Flavobacteriales bacterium]
MRIRRCDRDARKPERIIIRKGGDALRQLGTYSRIAISKYIDRKVFLDLKVKVDPDWRADADKLKKYGY